MPKMPEGYTKMIKHLPKNLEQYRITDNPAINRMYVPQEEGSAQGFFEIPYGNKRLTVMVGSDEQWDHLSVSLRHRCPTWPEMCYVKDLFFLENETVIQFHPPKSKHINLHKYCLHLWRPWSSEIALPPEWMVG